MTIVDVSIRAGYWARPLQVEKVKLRAACSLSDDWGGGRLMFNADGQIAALVEVGAIPYRERYQVRHV